MKALSIQPFYANLIALGQKFIELRTWKTNYRGLIVICSSKAQNKTERELLVSGHAIALADLEDVRPFVDESDRDAAALFDDETFEGYSWVFKTIYPIKPIPVKGQLRLFNLDIEEQIEFLDFPVEPEHYAEALQDYWYQHGYIKEKALLE